MRYFFYALSLLGLLLLFFWGTDDATLQFRAVVIGCLLLLMNIASMMSIDIKAGGLPTNLDRLEYGRDYRLMSVMRWRGVQLGIFLLESGDHAQFFLVRLRTSDTLYVDRVYRRTTSYGDAVLRDGPFVAAHPYERPPSHA